MFIIYGTTFYKRNNLKEHTGLCPWCKTARTISSFDGIKFFHVYGIPVIPLGRKKVLNMCSGCKQYLQFSMGKWNELRTTEIAAARASYNQDPANSGNAMLLFEAYEVYGTQEETASFLNELTSRFDTDAAVLARAASWFSSHNQPDQAVRFAEKSLAQDSSNDTARRTLLGIQTAKGELNSALVHALALENPEDQRDMLNLLQLASALRKKDRKREAYSVIQKIAALYPQQSAAHRLVRSEARLLEKQLNIQRSALLPGPSRKKDMIVAGAMAAGIAAMVLFGNFYMEGHQSMIISNAFGTPATVKVDEFPPLEIKPGDVKKVSIAEGEHSVQTSVGGKNLAPRKVHIVNSLYERFFDSPVFVLNLGGAGVIVREEIIYTSEHAPQEVKDKEGKYNLFTGQPLIALRGVDYSFVEPPKTMQLGKAEPFRTQIHAYALNLDPYQTLSLILDDASVPVEDVLGHMEGRIEAGQTDGVYVNLYRAIAAKNQLAERAEQFLTRR